MTNDSWQRIVRLLEENEKIIAEMTPFEPTPNAKVCSESAHFALGHLTSCQVAWLPLMRALRDGAKKRSIPMNPNPLFTKLGFASLAWEVLVERFVTDRLEWRNILEHVDISQELQTSRRVWTAQTLTKRMVEHENGHLLYHVQGKLITTTTI